MKLPRKFDKFVGAVSLKASDRFVTEVWSICHLLFDLKPKDSHRKALDRLSSILNVDPNFFTGFFEGSFMLLERFTVFAERVHRLSLVLKAFAGKVPDNQIVSWLQSPNERLDGRAPQSFLENDADACRLVYYIRERVNNPNRVNA